MNGLLVVTAWTSCAPELLLLPPVSVFDSAKLALLRATAAEMFGRMAVVGMNIVVEFWLFVTGLLAVRMYKRLLR